MNRSLTLSLLRWYLIGVPSLASSSASRRSSPVTQWAIRAGKRQSGDLINLLSRPFCPRSMQSLFQLRSPGHVPVRSQQCPVSQLGSGLLYHLVTGSRSKLSLFWAWVCSPLRASGLHRMGWDRNLPRRLTCIIVNLSLTWLLLNTREDPPSLLRLKQHRKVGNWLLFCTGVHLGGSSRWILPSALRFNTLLTTEDC